MSVGPTDRAVSEVLGFVLVFSLVVATVAIVSVYGLGSLEDVRDREQINNAERAFDVLADNFADIHREGAPSRATEINLEDAQLKTADPVTMNLTGVPTSGQPDVNSYSIEPIVYSGTGDTTIVYSGGAVFRVQPETARVSVEPSYILRSERIVFPIIQTRQTGPVTSVNDQTIRVRGEGRQRQPLRGFTGPDTSYEEIIVNVTSPRRDVWADHLESYEATDCERPRPDNVRCTIDDPESVYVSRALIAYEFEL